MNLNLPDEVRRELLKQEHGVVRTDSHPCSVQCRAVRMNAVRVMAAGVPCNEKNIEPENMESVITASKLKAPNPNTNSSSPYSRGGAIPVTAAAAQAACPNAAEDPVSHRQLKYRRLDLQ